MTKQKSVTVLEEGLAAERSLIVAEYEAVLKTLERRVGEAKDRLAAHQSVNSMRECITSHDAHHISNATQELAILAGRYEEFRRFERLARKEDR